MESLLFPARTPDSAGFMFLGAEAQRMKAPEDLFIPAPKLNQLFILKLIASNPEITQAELADHCALSVAMVNNYMKELRDRGYLEYRRKNSKCISYHLTKLGQETAGHTQAELLQTLAGFFANAKQQAKEIILSQAQGRLRRVVLFGNGDLAVIALHALDSAMINVIGVCTDDPSSDVREWCGRKVIDPSQVPQLSPDAVVIAHPHGSEPEEWQLPFLHRYGIDLIRMDPWSVDPASLQPDFAVTGAAVG
jgi:DNA-binding MarR family transcriptional regulator